MPEPNVVLLGPPGSGKGTQARPWAARHRVAYVSTGDLLRAAVTAGSLTGRAAEPYMAVGELVPDAIVLAVLREAVTGAGFVLDGFPRTSRQAERLDRELSRRGLLLPHAVVLEAGDDVLVERLGGRRICTAAGHEYHVLHLAPARPGVCDIDGSPLVRRTDDEPKTVRRRLAVHHAEAGPLLAHYELSGRLSRIDAVGPPVVVAGRLARMLQPVGR
jgi:adenylate kinase